MDDTSSNRFVIDPEDYVAFRTETRLFIANGNELFRDLREAHAQRLADEQRLTRLEMLVEKSTDKIAKHDKFIYAGGGMLALVGFAVKVWPWLTSILH